MQADQRGIAQTYRSDRLIEDAVAAAWYKRLIVEGARAHALPEEWYAWLDGTAPSASAGRPLVPARGHSYHRFVTMI